MSLKIAITAAERREAEKNYRDPNPGFAAAAEALLEGFSALPDIELHVLSCTRQPVPAPEKLASNIWYHNLHVPRIGWTRTLYQGCVRAVRKKLREIQPHIVHGMGTEHDCSLNAVLSGYPNVVTIHGNMRELARLSGAPITSLAGIYFRLTAMLEDFALRRTAGVFCHSTYTQNLVSSRTRQTWLVPHALRQKFFEPVPEISRPCVVLNAGVISPRKRQLELLDIAETLHRRGLKFEFRFIGLPQPTEYMAKFLERIRPMETQGYARFLGAVPDDELVDHFDSVAAMVHFPTEEAFGNVVIESLGRGLKFFGSRVGGIVDIASGMPGAELFEKDDWSGLANSMGQWIAGGHPRAAAAERLVRERYRPDVIARRHVEIYAELLRNKPVKR